VGNGNGQEARQDERLGQLEDDVVRMRDRLDQGQKQFMEIGRTLGQIETTLENIEDRLTWNRRIMWGIVATIFGMAWRILMV